MDSKSPLSPSVVMLVIAVFVLGGLAGYMAGSHRAAATTVASAPADPMMTPGGVCPMSGAKAPGACADEGMCSMAGAAKGKPEAACPKGGEPGKCADHPNCPDKGQCPTPKAAGCPMGGDQAKATAAKPVACPMGGEKGACADKDKCPLDGKCSHAVSKPAAAGKPAAASKPTAKAAYVCPMGCPGGTSDKPGKCPKCGMALEKK